jgi:tetratricopeptide (TPR) repeat protein
MSDHKQARAQYQMVLDQNPQHFHALWLLGSIESALKDLAGAIGLFERALKVDSRCAADHSHIGNAQLELGRSLEDYEVLALDLARDLLRLAAIRARLARNRTTHPLFDTDRLRRNIESAFATMVERSRGGNRPAPLFVIPAG